MSILFCPPFIVHPMGDSGAGVCGDLTQCGRRPAAGAPPPPLRHGRARRDATARPRSGRALNPALAMGFRPLAPVEAVEAVALL